MDKDIRLMFGTGYDDKRSLKEIYESAKFATIEKSNMLSSLEKEAKTTVNNLNNKKQIRTNPSGNTLKSSRRSIFESNLFKVVLIAGLIFTGAGIYLASKPLCILGIGLAGGITLYGLYRRFLSEIGAASRLPQGGKRKFSLNK